MSHLITTIAAAATLLAAPAFATGQTDKPQNSEPMTKKVCLRADHSTGTMLPKRTCMTRAEWIAQTGVDPLKKK